MNDSPWSQFLHRMDEDLSAVLSGVESAKNDSTRNSRIRRELLERFFSQLLTDDERARYMGLPEGCRLRENTKVLSPEKLRCGRHVWIGEGAMIDASGGLEIGDHVTIGGGVRIWTHHSMLSSLLMDNTPGNKHIVRKPTVIEAGAFIVGPAVINAGVRIGKGATILPMSVVTKDAPPYTILAGSPAVKIRDIDESYLQQLRQEREHL